METICATHGSQADAAAEAGAKSAGKAKVKRKGPRNTKGQSLLSAFEPVFFFPCVSVILSLPFLLQTDHGAPRLD